MRYNPSQAKRLLYDPSNSTEAAKFQRRFRGVFAFRLRQICRHLIPDVLRIRPIPVFLNPVARSHVQAASLDIVLTLITCPTTRRVNQPDNRFEISQTPKFSPTKNPTTRLL